MSGKRCEVCEQPLGDSQHGMFIGGGGEMPLCEACAARLCACAARLLEIDPASDTHAIDTDDNGDIHSWAYCGAPPDCESDIAVIERRHIGDACACDACRLNRAQDRRRSGSK